MATHPKGKAARATRVSNLLAGTKKRFQNPGQLLTVDGAQVTVGDITGKLQGFLDDVAAVATAKATLEVKLAAVEAEVPAIDTLVKGFVAALRVLLGPDAQALIDFGLEAPKVPAPMTAVQKAIAAEKRKATRQARGTKSAKQKKGIHGNVTAQLVVTPEAPATATPATPPTNTPPGPTKG